MGLAMEVISGFTTNPGATITAITVSTGDALAVRNFNQGANAYLLNVWGQQATAGLIRVRSPRLHDNVQDLRLENLAATPQPLLPDPVYDTLFAQDTLTVEQSGGGAETDLVSILNYYTDLPGTNARFYTWDEIRPRIVHLMSTEIDITTGGTAGQYGGATAINATFDQFKANQDYAILGYLTNTAVSTIGIKCADFGNLRIGGPGSTQRLETRDWFVRNDQALPMPFIPVFNAANKANCIVDVTSSLTSTAIVVTVLCAQLTT